MKRILLCLLLAGVAGLARSEDTNALPAWAVLPDASIEAPAAVLPDAVLESSPKRLVRLARKQGARSVPAASPGSPASLVAAAGDDDTALRLRLESGVRKRNFTREEPAP
jgi:hypothetical protein